METIIPPVTVMRDYVVTLDSYVFDFWYQLTELLGVWRRYSLS